MQFLRDELLRLVPQLIIWRSMRNHSLVNHPAHYNCGASRYSRSLLADCCGFSPYDLELECIEAMKESVPDEALAYFCYLSAVKYLWRMEHKDSLQDDLKKASWYVQLALSLDCDKINPKVMVALRKLGDNLLPTLEKT